MTREEAKEILENWNLCHYTPSREAAEAVISALDPLEIISALRPVSRKQVEKVWRSEWKPIERLWKYSHQWQCSRCGHPTLTDKKQFCDSCGAPMTDEAVQMVMDRLEALYETVE